MEKLKQWIESNLMYFAFFYLLISFLYLVYTMFKPKKEGVYSKAHLQALKDQTEQLKRANDLQEKAISMDTILKNINKEPKEDEPANNA